jgi:enamine deaminase RidA (YjgF/YER057c/UK114 family)
LGITLPEVTPTVAAFVPFVRSGNEIFVSGHIAKENGKLWVGQLGLNITTELGNRAARSVAIDLLATLNLAVGDLNKIKRIVKLMALVNSAPTFTEQHLVPFCFWEPGSSQMKPYPVSGQPPRARIRPMRRN